MTLLEEDLLAALKELHTASQAAISGCLLSTDELERLHKANEWSKRVIALAESGK